jgi:NTP pyrophosphatase (non-canonical NTP hydrolase)
MNIENAQQAVDDWIRDHGVRYFNELTNMAQLTEEVGEVARIIARRYGEQSEKESDREKDLGEELADVVLWFSAWPTRPGSTCRPPSSASST